VLGGETGRWPGGGGGGRSSGGSRWSVEGAEYGEGGGVRLDRLFRTDLEKLGGCGGSGGGGGSDWKPRLAAVSLFLVLMSLKF